MVDREVKAHRQVDHPNVMPLEDFEIVSKGKDREARLLFPYCKVCTSTGNFSIKQKCFRVRFLSEIQGTLNILDVH